MLNVKSAPNRPISVSQGPSWDSQCFLMFAAIGLRLINILKVKTLAGVGCSKSQLSPPATSIWPATVDGEN